jgi:exodeoxyribonuclease VII large subunit
MKTLTLTILQFNTFVKNILDAEEFLSNVSVVGEVTNFKMSGGHAYFDLKEESAMLSCVKFGAADLNIKNGDLLTVTGKVNFYVKSGRLNFIVSKVQAYGLGELYQRFLLLKEKLENMTGKAIVIKNTVDKTVLGGIKLRYLGRELDGTLKARLSSIEKSLKNTII